MEDKHQGKSGGGIMSAEETMGHCECCGLFEHHRIEGLCAGCIQKAVNFDEVKDEIPLGIEAADTSTISGFSGGTYAPQR